MDRRAFNLEPFHSNRLNHAYRNINHFRLSAFSLPICNFSGTRGAVPPRSWSAVSHACLYSHLLDKQVLWRPCMTGLHSSPSARRRAHIRRISCSILSNNHKPPLRKCQHIQSLLPNILDPPQTHCPHNLPHLLFLPLASQPCRRHWSRQRSKHSRCGQDSPRPPGLPRRWHRESGPPR